jgi:tRNA pseudouridine65 synthase
MVEQFTQRQVVKYYQALVRGWMHREGSLRIPLVTTDEESPSSHATREKSKQKAETFFSTIRWYELPCRLATDSCSPFSLIEAHPKTGRWHQIRRHLKHIAHPIIGDYRHGDDRYNRWFEEHYGNNRLLLASCLIEFRHPFSGNLTTIRAGRGETFDTLISKLTAFEVPIQTARLPQQPSSQKYESSQSDIWSTII